MVGVGFLDNKAAAINFQKTEKDILGQPEEISDNEIEILLNRNGDGKSWTKNKQLSLDRLWIREDGKMVASYQYHLNLFMIYTMDMVSLFDTSIKTTEAEKLDDF